MRFEIRREAEEDFRAVEELTREAFWNLNSPGCEEHYLVHQLRAHEDFLPELDFVAAHGAEIAASTSSEIWILPSSSERETYSLLSLMVRAPPFPVFPWMGLLYHTPPRLTPAAGKNFTPPR